MDSRGTKVCRKKIGLFGNKVEDKELDVRTHTKAVPVFTMVALPPPPVRCEMRASTGNGHEGEDGEGVAVVAQGASVPSPACWQGGDASSTCWKLTSCLPPKCVG